MFAQKKNLLETHKAMRDIVVDSFLKKEVVKRLDNDLELFNWRKRFGQYMGVTAFQSLIFANHTEFDKLRICYREARVIDDSNNFRVLEVQHQKVPRLPLRLTPANTYLLKEYMVEGAVYPALMSLGLSLRKVKKSFDAELLLRLYLKDMLSSNQEEGFDIDKYLEQTVDSYFMQVLKMTSKFDSKKGFKGVKHKNMLSMKHYTKVVGS